MKTIIKLNASGMTHTNCPFRFWNTMVEGYYAGVNSSKMVYGIGVHKYIDTMFKNKGHIGLARKAALAEFNKPKRDDKKSMWYSEEKHFLAVCYNTWEEWIMKDSQLDTVELADGLPATEVTFSIPYYEDEWVIVFLEGTVDRIAKVKGGCYVINDFKTTAQYNPKEYLDKYRMSGQMRFYILFLKLMGELYPDSPLGKIGLTDVRACIDGIFLKSSPAETFYQRSDVFPYNDIPKFRAALDATIQRLSGWVREKKEGKELLKTGILTGGCEGKWSLCTFFNVCQAQDEKIEKLLLERDFKKKPYEPLKHNEDV